MSGYNEIEADKHADEMGQIDRIEHQRAKAWDRDRADLVAALAMGEVLRVNDKRLLDFIDVRNRMVDWHEAEQDALFILAATNPELAGRRMKKLVAEAAEELVDLYADELMDKLENVA